ncbi:MAG: ABC transporter substrate-binding protein [Acidobacteriota bacterium]|nr:ABC transporter substrate-binding protein [Acidobacteriota bacterium]
MKNNWIWSVPSFRQAHGENIEIESQLAQNAGAYVGCCGAGTPLPMLRRFGLPVVYMWKPHKGDEIYFMAARTSAAVAGYPERGESLIARYRKSFADLDKELQPATLAHRPRVLVLSSKRADGRFLHPIGTRSIYDEAYFPRAGVVNALVGHDHSAGWDAERILAVDPGIIFVTVETPEEFLHDPRWQGLRAVAEKRVYSALGTMSRGPITTPVFVRQIAEIAHPERLLPRVRQLLRERFQSEFDYPLREDQIDYLLHIDANRESKGFDRFMREGQPAAPEGTTK